MRLVHKEVRSFPDQSFSRVFIGGTSQGCMSAIATLLRYTENTPLGGVVGQCGLQGLKQEHFSKAKFADVVVENTPMLLMHGDKDALIPIDKTFDSYKTLEKMYANKPENLKIETIEGGEHKMWEKCNGKIYDFLKKHQVKTKIVPPAPSRPDWAMIGAAVAMVAIGGYALYRF